MKYEENYQMPFFLATQKGTASLATLVNMLLLGSEHQLDAVDAGIAALGKEGAGWVITQYHLDVTRMPKMEEQVMLGTEAVSYNKLMTYRDYWLRTPAGEELARMSGAWVMMDLATRKIIPIKPNFAEKVGAVADSHVRRFPRIGKLSAVDAAADYRVRYFDIDGNGHVNNVHYFEWMEDVLGGAWLANHELATMDIKYAREVAAGTTPSSQVQIADLTTHHRIVTGATLNAEATLTWRQH